MPRLGWLTNDPDAAKKLKAADVAYNRARAAASPMCLSEKIAALRLARDVRDAAYWAVMA